jgi:hypothetical protein
MGPYGKDEHAATFGLPRTPIYAEMYKQISPLGSDAVFELCEPLIWVCFVSNQVKSIEIVCCEALLMLAR